MSSSSQWLVTGGCGFIGSNFIRLVLKEWPSVHLINLDALTYCGNPENLTEVQANPRYRFVHGSITDPVLVEALASRVDVIVNFAAESHVDRSIMDSAPFVQTNIAGTQILLDVARRIGVQRFVQISTDEVYGSLPLDDPSQRFTEQSPILPNSPYAASKAAADLMVRAAGETFGLDVVITRCSNNFGPWQFPEKVIPLFVTRLLEDQPVPLYGDGLNVRDWIHVVDHCRAILAVIERGRSGSVYNIGADNEQSNLALTHGLLQIMGKDETMIQHVTDRLGHDRRYAIDSTKIRTELGWSPRCSQWPEALEQTVQWYIEHRDWWQRVKSGDYRDYYSRQYDSR